MSLTASTPAGRVDTVALERRLDGDLTVPVPAHERKAAAWWLRHERGVGVTRICDALEPSDATVDGYLAEFERQRR